MSRYKRVTVEVGWPPREFDIYVNEEDFAYVRGGSAIYREDIFRFMGGVYICLPTSDTEGILFKWDGKGFVGKDGEVPQYNVQIEDKEDG